MYKKKNQLTKKQTAGRLRKKLEKTHSIEQLSKMYNALKEQSQFIQKDIAILKQKYMQVEEKRKKESKMFESRVLGLSTINQKESEEMRQKKKQLKEQYQIMKHLKNSLQKQLPTPQTTQTYELRVKLTNEINAIDKNISQLKQKGKTLKKDNIDLEQSIMQKQKQTTQNAHEVKLYEKQNGQLRKKITLLRQKFKNQQSQSLKIMSNIYRNKQRLSSFSGHVSERDLIDRIAKGSKNNNRQKIKSHSVTSISRHSQEFQSLKNMAERQCSQQLNNPLLIQQVQKLKQKVKQIQQTSINEKSSQSALKTKKMLQSQQLNRKFIALDKVKTKKINQLNFIKEKIKQLNEARIQQKSAIKEMKNWQYQENGFQFAYIHANGLRRDFAGIIGNKIRFDDRYFLRQKYKTFIRGLICYENTSNMAAKNSLAAIRAIYTSEQTNSANGIPLPNQYLQKCKVQRLQLAQDDFVKLIKIKYNNEQTRVSKIEIRTNKNHRFQFGEKRSFSELTKNQIVYAFDVGIYEYPSCLFGSFCFSKSCWYLESIGVQIETIEK